MKERAHQEGKGGERERKEEEEKGLGEGGSERPLPFCPVHLVH